MGVHRNFSMGGNVEILLILLRLLTMQFERTFTKCLLDFTAIVTKNALRGSNSKVGLYCDKLQNRFCRFFKQGTFLQRSK